MYVISNNAFPLQSKINKIIELQPDINNKNETIIKLNSNIIIIGHETFNYETLP